MAYRNSFEALGLDKEDAAVEALRADLAGIVRGWILQSQLTQAAAGKELGVSQGVISEILNGQTGRKSVEYFIRLLARIDVAWTARCWHAPADAAAIKGPAPMSWVSTGDAPAVRAVVKLNAARAQDYWRFVLQGGFPIDTSAVASVAEQQITVGAAQHG